MPTFDPACVADPKEMWPVLNRCFPPSYPKDAHRSPNTLAIELGCSRAIMYHRMRYGRISPKVAAALVKLSGGRVSLRAFDKFIYDEPASG